MQMINAATAISRRRRKRQNPTFSTLLDESMQAGKEKSLFKLVQDCLPAQIAGQINMAYLAWAFDAYISAKLYAGETIVWLRDGFV